MIIESEKVATSDATAALDMMLMIREFESRLPALSEEGLIRGSTHPSVGMEAIAVGVSAALRPRDKTASNHRGHAHVLAKGADPGRVLAEILGRSAGYGMGRGGSMHIGVAELGVLGTNGIVGASIGIATGAALAADVAHTGDVAVAYFGDGASNQGVLAEAFNLAAVWRLPIIFVCENNHYAQSASFEQMTAQTDLTQRGIAYGVPLYDVDGMDYYDVFAHAESAVARARNGEGPTFLVADTYRYLGHMAGDTEIYRDPDEVLRRRERDPIERLRVALARDGVVDDAGFTRAASNATAIVDAAYEFARMSPPPSGPVDSGVYRTGETA